MSYSSIMRLKSSNDSWISHAVYIIAQLLCFDLSGPGCSSIGGGAFTELGPFFPRSDGRDFRRNRMSWNKASILLYIESRLELGGRTPTQLQIIPAAMHHSHGLACIYDNWFEKFPAFKSRDLFLTGESYAAMLKIQLNHMQATIFRSWL